MKKKEIKKMSFIELNMEATKLIKKISLQLKLINNDLFKLKQILENK